MCTIMSLYPNTENTNTSNVNPINIPSAMDSPTTGRSDPTSESSPPKSESKSTQQQTSVASVPIPSAAATTFINPGHEMLEKPKPVSSTRKRDVLRSAALFHLYPAASAILMTVVYCKGWTWPHPGPSDEVQAALQFLAKIHEGITVASLSNILFHRVRYLLLEGEGTPLGLVTTPFQLNSPLFLFGAEFLGALRSLFSTFSVFLTFMLVTSVTVLALAAGPFSAIILIPRQLNFLMTEDNESIMRDMLNESQFSFCPTDGKDSYAILKPLPMSADMLKPMSIGPDLGVTWDCPALLKENSQGNCLSVFQDEFPKLLLASLYNEGKADFVEAEIPNVPEFGSTSSTDVIRTTLALDTFACTAQEIQTLEIGIGRLVRISCPFSTAAQALHTAQMAFIMVYLVGEPGKPLGRPSQIPDVTITHSYADEKGDPLPAVQPQVLVQTCGLYEVNTSSLSVEYLTTLPAHRFLVANGAGWFPAFNFTMDTELARLLLEKNWTAGFMTFVDIQRLVPFPISGAYIQVAPGPSPEPYSKYRRKSESTLEIVHVSIVVFVGTWAEATPSYVSVSATKPRNHAVMPGTPLKSIKEDLLSYRNTTTTEGVIKMDMTWLNALDIYPFELLPSDSNSGGLPRSDTRKSFFDVLATARTTDTTVIPMLIGMVMSAVHFSFPGVKNDWGFDSMPVPCLDSQDCLLRPDTVRYTFANNTDAQPDGQILRRVRFEQLAYGYKFEGTSIMLAFVFLWLHVLIIVVHLGVIVCGGWWNSSAWSNLGDFVVLGLGTKLLEERQAVRNAGAGVGSWRTWSFRATARSFESTTTAAPVKGEGEEQRLELVLSCCDGYDKGGTVRRRCGEKAGKKTRPNVKYR
ncbi:hypothetical protein B0H66DRAFT_310858 [Apodospora peruviana]|uniref:Transmembrane protein n=1 Tax=Apodospora peruviana TaxID=516989 RepID=A0AAE0I1U1_9PEZI|nr:hypothetical protein B0H66DRAFT_310858 [Apodospora peruviana]